MNPLKFLFQIIVKHFHILHFFAGILISGPFLSAQVKPISVFPLPNKNLHEGKNSHPIPLSNDSDGLFYFDYFFGDTAMFGKLSETSPKNYFVVTKDFRGINDLQHCILKDKNRLVALNLNTRSIQSFDCKGDERTNECKPLKDFKLNFDKNERPIRIEKDRQNIYLVSYNFDSHCQNFHLFNVEKGTLKLLYSNFDPFVEIFFLDPNVSNYSFYNSKLALTDFYSGNTLIINLLNSHIDTIKLPVLINEKQPTLSAFERLNSKYKKSSSMANYLALSSLKQDFNHVVNTYFLNDSTLLMNVRFKDINSAPFDLLTVNLFSQKVMTKQRRIGKTPISDTIKLSNMPIYLGFEESNYIGDGIIYVYKKMPALNQYNLRDFLNTMEQHGQKIGSFLLYQMF